MQATLGEAAAPFRSFFDDNASVMLLVAPESGAIVAANRAAAEFYGYTIDQLRQMHIGDLNLGDATEVREARMAALHKQRNAFEFPHRLANGEIRDVEVFATPVRNGARTLLLSIIHDVTARKRAERAVRASEQRLRAVGEIAYDLIYEWDPATGVLEWFGDLDQAPVQLGTGNRWDERTLRRQVHPDDVGDVEAAFESRRSGTSSYQFEYRMRAADGGYRWWLDRSSPLVDERGPPYRWVGGCTDITRRKIAEEQRRLAATVFTAAQEGIIIADASGDIIDVNEAFTRITGYSRAEAIGRNPRFLSSQRHGRDVYRAMWRVLQREGHWVGELWNRRRDGTLFAELLSISAVRDDQKNIQNYVALFTDITEQKVHQEQLEHIAYHDALTNLPNRTLLRDRLQQAIAQARRHGTTVAVVYLDLDGFKEVNDEFGHDVGDRLLMEVATRLQHTLREEDTVARLGGDEFVAVLVGLQNASASIDLLPRLLGAATQPLHVGNTTRNVSASLGVTFFPQSDAVDADQLLRQADQAMYRAKLDGKNRYHFFDAEQDRSVRGQVERLEQIQAALEADEFTLHYQPKVNMSTGEIVGAEALIRWPRASGGNRQPAEFLPLIEHHPLAIALGEWVIDSALTQMERWRDQGLEVAVSVNVSGFHLQQADFIDRLSALLQRHPSITPGDLTIEILETTALMDLQHVSAVIHAGQQLGVGFALDDFGTGYSSLSYLKSLPARQIKIDQSFVRDMLDDREDLAILEGIMGLATAFSRQPIAEGVESAEHGEVLLQLGCEIAQGYFIGVPMAPEQFVIWASRWSPDPLWLAQRPIHRADLPLVFSLVEHRAWVKSIEDLLAGRTDELPTAGTETCHFGRWFGGEGRERYGGREEYQELTRLHDEVHAVAARLIDRYEAGDLGAAERHLDEVHSLRDRMSACLKALTLEPAERRAAAG